MNAMYFLGQGYHCLQRHAGIRKDRLLSGLGNREDIREEKVKGSSQYSWSSWQVSV